MVATKDVGRLAGGGCAHLLSYFASMAERWPAKANCVRMSYANCTAEGFCAQLVLEAYGVALVPLVCSFASPNLHLAFLPDVLGSTVCGAFEIGSSDISLRRHWA